jgi:hypothetical protein
MPSALGGHARRDARIDLARGVALLMIFVDHIPDDWLNWITLHDLGFCDAAEVFVLLAGYSTMLAYGAGFARDGVLRNLRRIALRCLRIYVVQAFLLVITLLVVARWTVYFHQSPTIVAPLLLAPLHGVAKGLTLSALPTYLDILPLYLVFLACFPLIYLGTRRLPWLVLACSAGVWALAGLVPGLNLPNWLDGKGWYFNPFAWQFLFTIGVLLARLIQRRGALPASRWLAAGCALYLLFAFLQAAPWQDWHLPSLRLFAMAMPDKSHLAVLRIVDVLALFYLLMSNPALARLAQSAAVRPIVACGRHSLEVFAVGCIAALFGRLAFRTYGVGLTVELLINLAGLGAMVIAAWWLDRGRLSGPYGKGGRHASARPHAT